MQDIRYLERLSVQFPTAADAATEIINLSSVLNLPKGTEHFITDIHGEYEPFLHILKNGSGSIRKKIEEEFKGSLSMKEKKSLATLIYYPSEKLAQIEATEEDLDDWYKTTIYRLVRVNRRIASKYTRSRVRKELPHDYAYIIEELLGEKEEVEDKEAYYSGIISAIISTKRARHFVIAFCDLIQRLAVDRIHILGDLFDRGPGAHIILDTLLGFDNVDFQWGNHDICWMGAASGSLACIASVVRISAKYGNFATIENGYGINLLPLAKFALDTYAGDPCACFAINGSQSYEPYDPDMDRKIHKAITIILFKLEGQLIARHPEYNMDGRRLLDKIDREHGTVTIDGKAYPLEDTNFPTIDPDDPYRLSAGEALSWKSCAMPSSTAKSCAVTSLPVHARQHVPRLQRKSAVPRLRAAQRGRFLQGGPRGGREVCRQGALRRIGELGAQGLLSAGGGREAVRAGHDVVSVGE